MIKCLMLLSGWELGIWAKSYAVSIRFLVQRLNSSIEKDINKKSLTLRGKEESIFSFFDIILVSFCGGDFRGIYPCIVANEISELCQILPGSNKSPHPLPRDFG